MTPEQLTREYRSGLDAARLMADPAIQKALADVRAAILERWAASPLRDKDGQYELRLMLKLLGDLVANLEQAIADGKLAGNELKITEQRQSPVEKLRSIFR